jgi:hypothetical protein
MQAFFWFFLGSFFYLIVSSLISWHKKIKFISDIKIHSFKLIGFAFQQLVFALTAKYLIIEADSEYDEEKIKLYKNHDEAFFLEWKKNTVVGLQDSLPIYYREALEVENWDDLMNTLDEFYKKALKRKPN